MKKLIPLIIALAAFSVSTALAVSATSSPSPSSTPGTGKHKHKKTTTTATAAGSPAAASPSPARHAWFKPKKADSTAAASPGAEGAATPAVPSTSKGTKAVPSGTVAPGGGAGMVWVNTTTHVYHKEGSEWYGKTKHGKYLSEQDAIKEGDHADKEAK